ncbi:Chromosome partition protein Smc [Paenibacillus sp. CECT 9249]|uniref:AAA family ATPase n=1 Tax=Paenibacillus sp. CECT 9249 TaxID=2845385 RepID=UPI001E5230D7|nr:SMC family ATPase [Paenibacillus sp. CECT 9249]CAH0117799.1 Chromosome partition protein Smc [Paenibacillus sp. CECT 9249]
MRPLKLIMTAFGPYKDREEIDFTELEGHRLFVVSGNTGAGKTSIFDAICFALYGEASGEDRNDSKMLRSHFADDDTYTSVDFQFELKGQVYRVFRQLAHVKEGNKSATGDRYELYGIVDGRETPLTDRFIVTQVNEKLSEMIGLTKDQFSQIVMLPQGEFRKLLTSETENKEEILRRIFKTGLYKIVADRLNEKRRQMQRVCEELAGIREYHMNQVQGALSGREGSDLQRVFAQEHYNTHQVLEALDRETEHYAARIEELSHKLRELSAEFQRQTALYHQAQSVNEQFDLLDRKIADKQQLEDQAQHFEHKTKQLHSAEKAVHLEMYERHDAEMSALLVRRTKLYEEAAAECSQAEAALQDARVRYEREEAKGELREQAVRELERLQGLAPIVENLERKRNAIAELEAETAHKGKQLQAAEAELAAKRTERESISAQLKTLEERVGRLSERTEKLAALREQAAVVQEYLKLVQTAEQERREEARHQAAFEQAERAYSELEIRWVEGQAGILARHLHDGDPCPVCGSAEHPRKAEETGNIPSREELDRIRSEKSGMEQQYLQSKAMLAATVKQMREKEQRMREHGFLIEGIQERFQALVQEGKSLAAEVNGLKDDSVKLSALKQSLEELDAKVEQLSKLKDDLNRSLQDTKETYAAEKALYQQALAAIPEEVRDYERLAERMRTTEERKRQLEADWKLAQQQYKEGNERYVKAAAGVSHAQNQRIEAQADKEKAGRSFVQAMRQAGFEDEAAYHAAKMSESAQTELKRQIEEYHLTLSSLRRQIEELTGTLSGKARQKLAELQGRLQALEQQIESVRNLHMQAQNDYKKGTEAKANIIEAERNWKEAEYQHQVIKDLYDVVRGENGKKISFERYLQIEFLEQIIHIANERLQRISSGQYYLVRSDRLEKRGRQSGLGLDVYDNYTGQLRDVKTLSGGEKFNASLCLALGMADVIQSYEGGISLETMFIDEGFGALDEESLSKAIDTLIDLQQSGRTIGVISHVQELKQAIPAVLEVKKTKEGYSYTRFNVS